MGDEIVFKSEAEMPPLPMSVGTTLVNKTGSWRDFMPKFNKDKCVRCFLCYTLCPEPAIYLDEESYPVFDYDYCKGCGICANECPTKAIEMVRESK